LKYTDETTPRAFWDEDGIEVLSPSKDLYDFVHTKEDGTPRTKEEIGAQLNNLSHVLLIRFNGLKILLAGDAETKCWEYILEKYKDKIKDIDIFKAPHHGRESAFHEEAVKHMNPKHIILSHSSECEHTVPEKYQKAAPSAQIYKTSELGSFILDCDFDGNVTFS
jgi:beta-lactamase superfamily II metal-dependent hydrolase